MQCFPNPHLQKKCSQSCQNTSCRSIRTIAGSSIVFRKRYVPPIRVFASVFSNGRQDAETVATSLREGSKGQIRTGVYHADVPDSHKEDLHKRWREGSVQVVCATIGKRLMRRTQNYAYTNLFDSVWTGYR